MGQKTNPIGLRLGIVKGWESNWFSARSYADKLVEDEKIRQYLRARFPRGGVSRIIIERTPKRLIITIQTARPGIIIGRGGKEVEKLREEIKKLSSIDVQINIYEIKRPEMDSFLVAENIAQQLRARISFRRAMKQAVSSAMRIGAEGIKIVCSGRLGGAEMARTEKYMEGRVPLHTLRADIDYAQYHCQTIYGIIGIKVWIFKGELYGKVDLSPEAMTAKQQRGGFGGDERGGGGPRRDRDDRGGRGGRDDRSGGGGRGGRGGGGQGGRGGRGGGGQGGGGGRDRRF